MQNLSNPAITLNLTNNEVSILKADTGKPIETADDLIMLIGKVIAFTGIKQLPDDIVIAMCWKVMDHFKSFTKSNFIQAFEFNEAGIYEKRVEHFNAFLPAYMSEVLNNYRSMRNKAQSDYKKQLKAMEVEPESMTPEQSYNGLLSYIKENNSMPRFWDWNKVFIFMEEASLIEMTLEEKNMIFAKVKAEIEAKKKNATDLDELKELNLQLSTKNLVTECRRISVVNYLK